MTASEAPAKATAMALRFGGEGRVLSYPEVVPCLPEAVGNSPVSLDKSEQYLRTLGSFCRQLDVDRACAAQQVEPRDVWLLDSGATCHIVSASFLSRFRILKKRNRTVTLLNASGGEIVVYDIVDIEVHLGTLLLSLEEVLVADVAFNVLSPWLAAKRGWRTHLYKTGSRVLRGKKNLKLEGVNRAWWVLSGSQKKPSASKRSPQGMDVDTTPVRTPTLARSQPVQPPPGILKKTSKEAKEEARSTSATPRSLETTRTSEAESRRVLESSPFAFLVRSMRVAPPKGCESKARFSATTVILTMVS